MEWSSPLRDMASAATDVAREQLLRRASVRRVARPRPDDEPLHVLFTIDTEISMGGAARDPGRRPVGAQRRIWGETERGRYGIEYFMDVFESHGFKGVFFYEPIARHVVPEAELAEAASAIAQRGHDVELHIHPEFEMDLSEVQAGRAKTPSPLLFEHPFEVQRRLVKESLDVLEKWTGQRPCAFRAGGYSAGPETLRALEAEGVGIDSSYNLWAVQNKLSTLQPPVPANDATLFGATLEIPVTNLRTRVPRPGIRPLELSSLEVTETVDALEQLYAAGARTACIATHSFRLVRTKDVQYSRVAPDPINIHRLRALCRHLHRHRGRFAVTTFRDLPVARWRRDLAYEAPEPFFPSPPAWSSAFRTLVQGVKDRGVL